MERAVNTSATQSSRRAAYVAAASLVVVGVVLAATFFPLFFDHWLVRDDEGLFVMSLRQSLAGDGHLYSTIWSDLYGPFYYLFMSTVYRLIDAQPTLDNGRWITLVLTTGGAAFFGAAVWRVTKNLPSSLVAEVAAFLILINIAGNEPMHPGALGVFLVAVAAFAIAGYAQTRRTSQLVTVGVATGALMMTKVNTGGLLAVAIVFGLVVGNRNAPRWLRIAVAVLATLIPLVLLSQRLMETWVDILVLLVVGSMAGMVVVVSIDPLPITVRPLVPIASGAAVAVLGSLAYPVVTGTPLGDEIRGVFIRPLRFANGFSIPATIRFNWLLFVLSAGAVAAAVILRSMPNDEVRARTGWAHAALAAFGLGVLGIGVSFWQGWVSGAWLPGLVALPALAFCCASPEPIRLALRLLVPLALLQVLLVYPVAGSQVAWGTVAMVVPCGIAMAVGIDHSKVWRQASWLKRGAVAVVVSLALVAASGASSVSPLTAWKGYVQGDPLGLPGSDLMRIDPAVQSVSFGVLGAVPTPHLGVTIRGVVSALRANCDALYGVPNLNSFNLWSGVPPVTGMVANGGPGGLTASQQRQVIDGIEAKEAANERVCILRDGTVPVPPPGPLTDVLNQYQRSIATVDNYTISSRF